MEKLAPDRVAGRSLDLELEGMRSDGRSRWLTAQQNPDSHGNAGYFEDTRSNLVSFAMCARLLSGDGRIVSAGNSIDITTQGQE